ncbi:MAG TPA: radical SAM protein, partial [Clostridia bacterium]
MNKPADILLINSLSPRQRSLSDTCLENSLCILRTYLEEKGFNVVVFDRQRTHLLEKGVPRFIFKILRILVKQQIKFMNSGKKTPAMLSMLAAWPFHSAGIKLRKLYLDKLIKEIVSYVKENKIRLVGIKTWYGDSYKWSVRLSESLKAECPECIVFCGGPHVKVHGERILNFGSFDLAISGAGELVLEELIRLIRKHPHKNNFIRIVTKMNGGSKLLTENFIDNRRVDIIPHYREEDLENKIHMHTIVDGIGCTWNKCAFCSHPKVGYTLRDVDLIIKEMKLMINNGISLFRFSSSDTSIDHGRRISDAILKNKLNIRYSFFSRCSGFSPERYESYKLMIESGLKAVFLGGETGNDKINRIVMNKGVCRKDIIDTINLIKDASKETGKKCYIGLAMIYPCPLPQNIGVTMEEIFNDNISLIEATMPDTVIITPPSPLPDTNWLKNSSYYGFEFGDDYLNKLMNYEYVMYKPPELWPELDISLNSHKLSEFLAETGRLRKKVNSMGIPTDIVDEYFLMADSIG